METAAACTTALGFMEGLAAIANPRLLSDLRIAAILAESSAQSAGLTAHANLAEVADLERRTHLETELRGILEHGHTLRASIERHLQGHLK